MFSSLMHCTPFLLCEYFFPNFIICMAKGWTKVSWVGRFLPTYLHELWVIIQCTGVSELCWEVSEHSEVSYLAIKWQSILDQWFVFIPFIPSIPFRTTAICHYVLSFIFLKFYFACSLLLFSANSGKKNPSKAKSIHQLLPSPLAEIIWEPCFICV